MEFIGTLITYLMMACCVVGGISYIVNDQSELGRAFHNKVFSSLSRNKKKLNFVISH